MIKWLSADSDWYFKTYVTKSSTGFKAICDAATKKIGTTYTSLATKAETARVAYAKYDQGETDTLYSEYREPRENANALITAKCEVETGYWQSYVDRLSELETTKSEYNTEKQVATDAENSRKNFGTINNNSQSCDTNPFNTEIIKFFTSKVYDVERKIEMINEKIADVKRWRDFYNTRKVSVCTAL